MRKNKKYSAELKIAAVKSYLAGEGGLRIISKRYGISDHSIMILVYAPRVSTAHLRCAWRAESYVRPRPWLSGLEQLLLALEYFPEWELTIHTRGGNEYDL